MKKINLIVIGSGAYVCGKNTSGFGTILPALIEATRRQLIQKITVVSRHSSTEKIFNKKIKDIQNLSKIKLDYLWYNKKNDLENGYKKAIENSDENTVVIVATPDNLHYEMTAHSLKNQKHTLVVKPLTPKINEAKALIKLSKNNKLLTIVDFHKRYDLANLKLRNMIKSNKIGIPQYFHIEYSQQREIPQKIFKSWLQHTNIFQYLGVHYVDIINFVTDAIPIRVMSMGQKNILKKIYPDTYDSIQTIIEWKYKNTKFVSTLLCNWIDPNSTSAVSYQSIKVIGSEGRIESDQKNRGYEVITKNGVENMNLYFNQDYFIDEKYHFKGYGIDSILQFFLDSYEILNKKNTVEFISKHRPTFEKTLSSVIVIDAANKSLKNNGKWIYCDNK
jgi:D-galacturonate reductase